jgi:hypothetical protein
MSLLQRWQHPTYRAWSPFLTAKDKTDFQSTVVGSNDGHPGSRREIGRKMPRLRAFSRSSEGALIKNTLLLLILLVVAAFLWLQRLNDSDDNQIAPVQLQKEENCASYPGCKQISTGQVVFHAHEIG